MKSTSTTLVDLLNQLPLDFGWYKAFEHPLDIKFTLVSDGSIKDGDTIIEFCFDFESSDDDRTEHVFYVLDKLDFLMDQCNRTKVAEFDGSGGGLCYGYVAYR